MQHREGRHLQPGERAPIIEIADERDDAMSAQPARVITVASKAYETGAMREPLRDAQRDVAATYEHYALHRAAGASDAPVENAQSGAACDPAQERFMQKSTQPR